MTQPDPSSGLSELDCVLAARFGGYTRNRPAEADAGPILDTYGDGPADEMDRLLDPDARRLDSPY